MASFSYKNSLLHPSARDQETLLAQDGEIVDAAIAPLEKALTTNKVPDLPLGVMETTKKGS